MFLSASYDLPKIIVLPRQCADCLRIIPFKDRDDQIQPGVSGKAIDVRLTIRCVLVQCRRCQNSAGLTSGLTGASVGTRRPQGEHPGLRNLPYDLGSSVTWVPCEGIEDVQKSAANAGRTLGKRAPGDSSGSLQFSICL